MNKRYGAPLFLSAWYTRSRARRFSCISFDGSSWYFLFVRRIFYVFRSPLPRSRFRWNGLLRSCVETVYSRLDWVTLGVL